MLTKGGVCSSENQFAHQYKQLTHTDQKKAKKIVEVSELVRGRPVFAATSCVQHPVFEEQRKK